MRYMCSYLLMKPYPEIEEMGSVVTFCFKNIFSLCLKYDIPCYKLYIGLTGVHVNISLSNCILSPLKMIFLQNWDYTPIPNF